MDQTTTISRQKIDIEKEQTLIKSFTINKVNWIIKRTIDILFSIIAIIILSPVMIILAIIIYLDDPTASPIFIQPRCGRKGKIFRFLKFRSMVADAENMLVTLQDKNEMSGPVFKIKDDPRITRIGKFIRKTSIDELPQLFNVLVGNMSVVGPRPPLPREVEQYNEYQLQRLYVTPGLTCYWQVTPKRNSLSFDEWVELDLKYIRERNLWIDIKLVFKTINVMLKSEGV